MKAPRSEAAFTLVELILIIAVIAILAAMFLPTVGGPRLAEKTICANNLRRIGEDFRMWSLDHDDELPMQVSTNDGGTLELVQSGSACAQFLALTNSGQIIVDRAIVFYEQNGTNAQRLISYTNYGIEPRMLMCPSDERSRWPYKTAMSDMVETNISYFVGLDATKGNPKSILAGDRNLEVDDVPVKPGLLTLNKISSVGWAQGLHFSKSISKSGGNVLFTDGHVEYLKPKALDVGVHDEGLLTNRFAIP